MTELGDFRALVDAYQSAIYRVAYRLTGGREDAEDLVQETLVEAYMAFPRFKPGTRFDQWVYRIMTRNYIDLYRRRRKTETVSLEEMTEIGEPFEVPDSASDPQQVLDRGTWSEPVQVALIRLTPEYRATVVLCDVQGLSYEEASVALRCPVGTVRSRLHRARAQLRESLRPKEGQS